MNLVPFNYELDPARIAQRPVYPYDAAKLLIIDRRSPKQFSSCHFSDLPEYLRPGDLIIVNDTRVAPVRLFGQLLQNGTNERGRQIELLLLARITGENCWKALAKPLKALKTGSQIWLSERLSCKVLGVNEGHCELELFLTSSDANTQESLNSELEAAGKIPIPPYIRRGNSDATDKQDYQTLWGQQSEHEIGSCSVAASTAALHFTPQLVANLKSQGVLFASLTLQMGAASILPLREVNGVIAAPPPERVVLDPATVQLWQERKAAGSRVISCGTSVVRALESYAQANENTSHEYLADILISPGHQFKMTDAVITNFHYPGSSHLLLVEALLARELLAKSYQTALDSGFRFLSYGDAMLVL